MKPPIILSQVFQSAWWKIPTEDKVIYLTFDDGPFEGTTNFILDSLKQFDCTATFFCLGEQVKKNPQLFKAMIDQGHGVGNHAYSHLNGWKTDSKNYLASINEANRLIKSKLFRPPYGKLSWAEWKGLKDDYQLVMWSLMPGDFDENLKSEAILDRLQNKSDPGEIVVLHENAKSENHIKYVLPKYLSFLKSKGFEVKKLPDVN